MFHRTETRDDLGRLVQVDWAWDATLKGAAVRAVSRAALQAAARYRQCGLPEGEYRVETRTDLPDRVRMTLVYRDRDGSEV